MKTEKHEKKIRNNDDTISTEKNEVLNEEINQYTAEALLKNISNGHFKKIAINETPEEKLSIEKNIFNFAKNARNKCAQELNKNIKQVTLQELTDYVKKELSLLLNKSEIAEKIFKNFNARIERNAWIGKYELNRVEAILIKKLPLIIKDIFLEKEQEKTKNKIITTIGQEINPETLSIQELDYHEKKTKELEDLLGKQPVLTDPETGEALLAQCGDDEIDEIDSKNKEMELKEKILSEKLSLSKEEPDKKTNTSQFNESFDDTANLKQREQKVIDTKGSHEPKQRDYRNLKNYNIVPRNQLQKNQIKQKELEEIKSLANEISVLYKKDNKKNNEVNPKIEMLEWFIQILEEENSKIGNTEDLLELLIRITFQRQSEGLIKKQPSGAKSLVNALNGNIAYPLLNKVLENQGIKSKKDKEWSHGDLECYVVTRKKDYSFGLSNINYNLETIKSDLLQYSPSSNNKEKNQVFSEANETIFFKNKVNTTGLDSLNLGSKEEILKRKEALFALAHELFEEYKIDDVKDRDGMKSVLENFKVVAEQSDGDEDETKDLLITLAKIALQQQPSQWSFLSDLTQTKLGISLLRLLNDKKYSVLKNNLKTDDNQLEFKDLQTFVSNNAPFGTYIFDKDTKKKNLEMITSYLGKYTKRDNIEVLKNIGLPKKIEYLSKEALINRQVDKGEPELRQPMKKSLPEDHSQDGGGQEAYSTLSVLEQLAIMLLKEYETKCASGESGSTNTELSEKDNKLELETDKKALNQSHSTDLVDSSKTSLEAHKTNAFNKGTSKKIMLSEFLKYIQDLINTKRTINDVQTKYLLILLINITLEKNGDNIKLVSNLADKLVDFIDRSNNTELKSILKFNELNGQNTCDKLNSLVSFEGKENKFESKNEIGYFKSTTTVLNNSPQPTQVNKIGGPQSTKKKTKLKSIFADKGELAKLERAHQPSPKNTLPISKEQENTEKVDGGLSLSLKNSKRTGQDNRSSNIISSTDSMQKDSDTSLNNIRINDVGKEVDSTLSLLGTLANELHQECNNEKQKEMLSNFIRIIQEPSKYYITNKDTKDLLSLLLQITFQDNDNVSFVEEQKPTVEKIILDNKLVSKIVDFIKQVNNIELKEALNESKGSTEDSIIKNFVEFEYENREKASQNIKIINELCMPYQKNEENTIRLNTEYLKNPKHDQPKITDITDIAGKQSEDTKMFANPKDIQEVGLNQASILTESRKNSVENPTAVIPIKENKIPEDQSPSDNSKLNLSIKSLEEEKNTELKEQADNIVTQQQPITSSEKLKPSNNAGLEDESHSFYIEGNDSVVNAAKVEKKQSQQNLTDLCLESLLADIDHLDATTNQGDNKTQSNSPTSEKKLDSLNNFLQAAQTELSFKEFKEGLKQGEGSEASNLEGALDKIQEETEYRNYSQKNTIFENEAPPSFKLIPFNELVPTSGTLGDKQSTSGNLPSEGTNYQNQLQKKDSAALPNLSEPEEEDENFLGILLDSELQPITSEDLEKTKLDQSSIKLPGKLPENIQSDQNKLEDTSFYSREELREHPERLHNDQYSQVNNDKKPIVIFYDNEKNNNPYKWVAKSISESTVEGIDLIPLEDDVDVNENSSYKNYFLSQTSEPIKFSLYNDNLQNNENEIVTTKEQKKTIAIASYTQDPSGKIEIKCSKKLTKDDKVQLALHEARQYLVTNEGDSSGSVKKQIVITTKDVKNNKSLLYFIEAYKQLSSNPFKPFDIEQVLVIKDKNETGKSYTPQEILELHTQEELNKIGKDFKSHKNKKSIYQGYLEFRAFEALYGEKNLNEIIDMVNQYSKKNDLDEEETKFLINRLENSDLKENYDVSKTSNVNRLQVQDSERDELSASGEDCRTRTFISGTIPKTYSSEDNSIDPESRLSNKDASMNNSLGLDNKLNNFNKSSQAQHKKSNSCVTFFKPNLTEIPGQGKISIINSKT